ncbi:hypothetical protein GGR51DRAFT_560458 [Nemania sp. FL0031]|nr:hypothetical protein GGR51DRAFT_560458 [Nemania sp. FL0031]
MANGIPQMDYTQSPAVDGAVGYVLANGQFQCALMTRHGVATNYVCGATLKNKAANIKSHLSKIHNPHSTYATSQAGFTKNHGLGELACDRPRLDGKGWCTITRAGQHSLVAHARESHRFQGKSASLTTPWVALTDAQRAYYQVRVDLEVRREQNGGVYTAEDEALNKRLQEGKFPDA